MSRPSTDSEWMLYRVLQRANLVQYFEMFTAQGGDDVYQLCEAGEEEFLEIMALVGMASKPLHVRRLQRALHEWLVNPASFKTSDDHARPLVSAPAKGSILASVPHSVSIASTQYWTQQLSHHSGRPGGGGGGGGATTVGSQQDLPGGMSVHQNGSTNSGVKQTSNGGVRTGLSQDEDSVVNDRTMAVSPCLSQVSAGGHLESQLNEAQLKALEICAFELSKTLPMYAPRPLNVKKPIDKEIEEVLNYPDDYPNRIEILRKYSAIYGRFDSKRKSDKQMNLHEMCVNEAAAQLCRYRPSLLTRREELFTIARQVVRESGFQYSKGHSRTRDTSSDAVPPAKRIKTESAAAEFSSSRNCAAAGSVNKEFFESIDNEDSLNAPAVGCAWSSGGREENEAEGKTGGSLVDEGLRIAQQYGLGDFAEELREMKKESLDYSDNPATEAGEEREEEEVEDDGDDEEEEELEPEIDSSCDDNKISSDPFKGRRRDS